MTRTHSEAYIFTTSQNPDPYVNVLAYIGQKYSLSKVYFVGIAGHEYQNEQSDTDPQDILRRVRESLESLARGEYQKEQPDGSTRVVDLAVADAKRYEACLSWLRSSDSEAKTISFRDLGEFLAGIDRLAIVDVTALRKSLLVDVVTLLLSRGRMPVWSFELLDRKPTHDEQDLIHARVERQTFEYREITRSPHVDAAGKQMLARAQNFRKVLASSVVVIALVLASQLWLKVTIVQAILNALVSAVSVVGYLLFLWDRRLR